jgi:hypothetical protein
MKTQKSAKGNGRKKMGISITLPIKNSILRKKGLLKHLDPPEWELEVFVE